MFAKYLRLPGCTTRKTLFWDWPFRALWLTNFETFGSHQANAIGPSNCLAGRQFQKVTGYFSSRNMQFGRRTAYAASIKSAEPSILSNNTQRVLCWSTRDRPEALNMTGKRGKRKQIDCSAGRHCMRWQTPHVIQAMSQMSIAV